MPQIHGYARVSADGQTLDEQLAQLKTAGAERVFNETVSGAKRERAQLQKLLSGYRNLLALGNHADVARTIHQRPCSDFPSQL